VLPKAKARQAVSRVFFINMNKLQQRGMDKVGQCRGPHGRQGCPVLSATAHTNRDI
jgi:hypothetical protein